jgi:hypothetical protein
MIPHLMGNEKSILTYESDDGESVGHDDDLEI